MSPRNDVNRSVKLARGLGPLQHNNALDSVFAGKESLAALFSAKISAALQHLHKKRRAPKGRVFVESGRLSPVVQPIAFTRADRRDIFRAAVFL